MFCGLKSFVGAAVFSQLDVNIRAEFDDRPVIYLASITHQKWDSCEGSCTPASLKFRFVKKKKREREYCCPKV